MRRGFSQTLWLHGDGEVTEVGTMNFFVFWVNSATGRRELVTAPLDDGTILPGVTRRSVLDLARGWGEFDVSERRFTITEVRAAAAEGRLLEAFGAGTAAVVSPVRRIHHDGHDIDVPCGGENAAGPLTRRVWDTLNAIHYGDAGFEAHPWARRL